MATFCKSCGAQEIDQPFGTDPNDLPMKEIQEDFNNSLLFLMEEKTQMVPKFTRWKRDMRITHVVKHDHSSCHVGSPAVAALPPTKIGIDRPAEAVNEAEAAAFASQPSGLTRKPKVRRQRRVKSQSETEAEAQATWDAASSAAVVAIEEVQEQAAKSGLEEQQSVEEKLGDGKGWKGERAWAAWAPYRIGWIGIAIFMEREKVLNGERRHSGSSMNPPQLMSHVPIDGDRVVLLDYPVTADGEEMTERMRTFVAESDGDGEVMGDAGKEMKMAITLVSGAEIPLPSPVFENDARPKCGASAGRAAFMRLCGFELLRDAQKMGSLPCESGMCEVTVMLLVDPGRFTAAGLASMADGALFNWSKGGDRLLQGPEVKRTSDDGSGVLVKEADCLKFVMENGSSPEGGLWIGGSKFRVLRHDREDEPFTTLLAISTSWHLDGLGMVAISTGSNVLLCRFERPGEMLAGILGPLRKAAAAFGDLMCAEGM
eukprot:g28298.t2